MISTVLWTSIMMWHYLLWVWTGSWWTLPFWGGHNSSSGPAGFLTQGLVRRHLDQLQVLREHADLVSLCVPPCPTSLPFPDSLLSPPNRFGRHDTRSGQRYTSLLMSWPPTGPQHCQTPGRTQGCPRRAVQYKKKVNNDITWLHLLIWCLCQIWFTSAFNNDELF